MTENTFIWIMAIQTVILLLPFEWAVVKSRQNDTEKKEQDHRKDVSGRRVSIETEASKPVVDIKHEKNPNKEPVEIQIDVDSNTSIKISLNIKESHKTIEVRSDSAHG